MTQALIKYEAACYAIAECVRVDEVKEWADKAAAMQAYGRMAQDQTLQAQAAEIRIRAERRLGELLAGQKTEGGLSRGAAGAGINQHTPAEVRSSQTTAPTLADAGISKDLSSRAQKLAAVPEQEFEAALAAKRERDLKDGARVSARLEAAGAKVLKQAAKETPASSGPVEPSEPTMAEKMAELVRERDAAVAAMNEALADNTRMGEAFDADDRTKALFAENQKLRAQVSTLTQRINGLMNEKNEAVRAAKAWQRKAQQVAA